MDSIELVDVNCGQSMSLLWEKQLWDIDTCMPPPLQVSSKRLAQMFLGHMKEEGVGIGGSLEAPR